MRTDPTSISYRAVLFDLDGTLLDTAPDFVTALNRMLVNRRLTALDPALIRAAVTNGSAGLITLAFNLQPGDAEFDGLKQEFLDFYRDCLSDKTGLFPGMDGVLARLSREALGHRHQQAGTLHPGAAGKAAPALHPRFSGLSGPRVPDQTRSRAGAAGL